MSLFSTQILLLPHIFLEGALSSSFLKNIFHIFFHPLTSKTFPFLVTAPKPRNNLYQFFSFISFSVNSITMVNHLVLVVSLDFLISLCSYLALLSVFFLLPLPLYLLAAFFYLSHWPFIGNSFLFLSHFPCYSLLFIYLTHFKTISLYSLNLFFSSFLTALRLASIYISSLHVSFRTIWAYFCAIQY